MAAGSLCVGLLISGLCLGAGHIDRKTPVIVTGCSRIVVHDQDFQRRVADELKRAAPELRIVAREWLNLRDQARTCRNAGKNK